MMNLNYNTWVETWNNNKAAYGEGYNFNSADWDWLGGGNINSDGHAWQSTRVENAAGTASGAYDDTASGNVVYKDGSGNNIAYYTEINKNGRYDADTNKVTWDFTSAWDYAYQDNGDFWGEFLGGYELDGGEKVSFDKDWNEIGREVNTSNLTTLTDDQKAALPDFVTGATHASYKDYNSDYPTQSEIDALSDAAVKDSYTKW
jgi:hypothetical protein